MKIVLYLISLQLRVFGEKTEANQSLSFIGCWSYLFIYLFIYLFHTLECLGQTVFGSMMFCHFHVFAIY